MKITKKIRLEMCAPSDFETLNEKYDYTCKEKFSISIGKTKKEVEKSFREINSILWRAYNIVSYKCGEYIYLNKDWGKVSNMNNELYVFANKKIEELMSECSNVNNIPSSIVLRLLQDVVSKISSKECKKEIKGGKRKTPEFTKGVPLGVNTKALKFFSNENEYYIRLYGIWFKTVLSKDKQGNRKLINHIINGDNDYKACDSTLSIKENGKNKKNDYILNLSVKIPENKNLLDSNRVMGIDLGMHNVAVGAICDSITGNIVTNEYSNHELIAKFDSGEIEIYSTFLQKKVKTEETPILVQKRDYYKHKRERLRKECELTGVSGHGRKAKMKKYYDYGHKEHNAMMDCFHNISNKIIKYAIKNNCGKIQMEDLSGFSKNESILASYWGYYHLQQMIEYKAKKEGISVIYVNPKYTSKTCSNDDCGYINNGLKREREWICPNCGKHHDRDVNAAINIARIIK